MAVNKYREDLKVILKEPNLSTISAIKEIVKENNSFNLSDADRRSILDQVLRCYVLDLVLSNPKNVFDICKMWTSFTIDLVRNEMCTAIMPVVILSDMFDVSTMDCCEKMFDHVECNVHVLKEHQFFTACKNNLLRMCNDLLRRLSRSRNTVFCGRILLFLAKFFPFSERSGLNIVSEFNLENVTEYLNESSFDLVDDNVAPDSSIGDEYKSDIEKVNVNKNLYLKFWSLQDYFRNPNQCYKPEHWKLFTTHTDFIFSTFQSHKLEHVSRMDNGDQVIHYFPKYLTNHKLLELQLSDVNFRRYILIQFLLLFQYLNAPVKFKPDNYKLKFDQQEWIKNATNIVYDLINTTPPDGVNFSEVVKNILKREEQWNKWKNDGCPEVTKRPICDNNDSDMPTTKRRPRRNLGDVIKNMTVNNKVFLGDPELTKLWNFKPNNLEACKGPERDFLPSFDTFFQEAFEQLDPELCIESQFRKVNDGNFGWRALRLLARKSPHFFAQSNNPIHKLSEYLENMIKKTMSKEKQMPVNQGSDKRVSPSKELKKESLAESEEVDITDCINDENENENNDEIIEDKNKIPKHILNQVAEKIGDRWNLFAEKVGYQPDEIEFVKSIRTTPLDQALYLLEVWIEDVENPKPEDLIYILEEIQLIDAAKILKSLSS
ncbi:THO complex subunit 1 isoform X2 [Daktulosphaira vitifoliae]|uniref:THO complex subunit 1 isoform X2 n=1 Tax=Daktulosphaira vitifoliae TaxID=58002 RepID=UPI0021AA1B91|nr:THO complex subunit 1 isoform X2 [Daktulosphaira vitifoliae]